MKKGLCFFPKNPAQHFVDLAMIENEEAVLRPAPVPQVITKIENASELTAVQMKALCTKKCNTGGHLETKSLATFVLTRNSGRSFKNRVELQNGCLALGYANTFIPSTLNGSCVQNGKVSEEILKKSMDLDIDVCISRADKCPCAGTVINLYKGACCTDLQYSMSEWLLRPFSKEKEKKNSF